MRLYKRISPPLLIWKATRDQVVVVVDGGPRPQIGTTFDKTYITGGHPDWFSWFDADSKTTKPTATRIEIKHYIELCERGS